jgi:SAM-dependent methyltransferase
LKIKPKVYDEIDFNSVEASEEAVQIMRRKKCLNDIYCEMYRLMMHAKQKYLTNGNRILEIGSGGGFIKDIYPDVITSDIKKINNVDMVVNAEKLPFDDESVDAIFAVHVIHHIPDIELFLHEAGRVLKAGGGIVCIEPYWSPIASFVYKNMHPEPFDRKALKWQLDGTSPMTSSNQALSYILLKRDNNLFRELYPNFKVVYRKRFGFIRYMMTGGIWLKQKLPNWMFPVLKAIEIVLTPFMPFLALHHIFVWKKVL